MTVKKKSLVTLALVAVVGVGLVGAYSSNACDEEKAATEASAKKTDAIHASGSSCSKVKGTVQQASAEKGECTYSKTGSKAECTSAQKASAKGSDCCASKAKGAMQASAGTNAAVIPVGAGGACQHGASKASAKSAGATCEFADNCDGCKMYKAYWPSLEQASREVVTLPDGILVHMTSDDAAVVADLQKFADAKAAFMRSISDKSFTGKLCSFCEEKTRAVKGASFRVANATNGVYTVITSATPETVAQLHKIAEAETAVQASVEG
jgi:hypothetical protein